MAKMALEIPQKYLKNAQKTDKKRPKTRTRKHLIFVCFENSHHLIFLRDLTTQVSLMIFWTNNTSAIFCDLLFYDNNYPQVFFASNWGIWNCRFNCGIWSEPPRKTLPQNRLLLKECTVPWRKTRVQCQTKMCSAEHVLNNSTGTPLPALFQSQRNPQVPQSTGTPICLTKWTIS